MQQIHKHQKERNSSILQSKNIKPQKEKQKEEIKKEIQSQLENKV